MAHVLANPAFVNQIVKRLSGRGDPYKPYITEKVIRQTKSLHITAIWDAWASLEAQARSAVLLDSYEAAKRYPNLSIQMALGTTVSEAIHLGLLPFAIVPTVRKTDPVDMADVKAAARSLELGFYVEGKRSFQIRFHTEEEAENAFRTLMQKFGGEPYFAIQQEVATIPSLDL